MKLHTYLGTMIASIFGQACYKYELIIAFQLLADERAERRVLLEAYNASTIVPTFSELELKSLIRLLHPDRHTGNDKRQRRAEEITKKVNKLLGK